MPIDDTKMSQDAVKQDVGTTLSEPKANVLSKKAKKNLKKRKKRLEKRKRLNAASQRVDQLKSHSTEVKEGHLLLSEDNAMPPPKDDSVETKKVSKTDDGNLTNEPSGMNALNLVAIANEKSRPARTCMSVPQSEECEEDLSYYEVFEDKPSTRMLFFLIVFLYFYSLHCTVYGF